MRLLRMARIGNDIGASRARRFKCFLRGSSIVGAALFFTVGTRFLSAASPEGRYTQLSMGTKSCAQVFDDFEHDARAKLSNSIWVAGYLTAYNRHVADTSDVSRGTEPKAWDLWIANYCKAHPLESLAEATEALTQEFVRRNKK
jgi:hypothetical protein